MINVNPILEVEDIAVEFSVNQQFSFPWQQKKFIKAVDGVSFSLQEGETMGIVGETGCGKSSLARAIIKMIPIKSGKVFWRGDNIISFNKSKTQKILK